MTPLKRARLLITIVTALVIIAASTVAIYFAKGYRPNLKGGIISGTGLLSATSYPKSAQVFVDGKLTTATDATINLAPGDYDVVINKEGFKSWEKHLKIEAELVTSSDARLFPSVPSLMALTYNGAVTPQSSPDGHKIAYFVSSTQSDDKKGLYVLDINNSPLPFNRTTTQVTRLHPTYKMETAHILWSPDSKQILIAFIDPKKLTVNASYLLDSDSLTNFATSPDVTVRIPQILSQWEETLYRQEADDLKLLPEFMVNIATSSAINVYFSPTKEKIVYTTTTKVELPDNIIPAVAAINSTPQTRNLEPNNIYVYDIKEDTNFLIGPAPLDKNIPVQKMLKPAQTTVSPTGSESATDTSKPSQVVYNTLQQAESLIDTFDLFKAHYSPLNTASPVWYQTSRHLITLGGNQINIFEYDHTNINTVYEGSIDTNFFLVSPTGDRLFLLTNLNQTNLPLNLYTLDLK